MKRDYYEVLGVARDAGDEELKKAYRRCAMKYHPDRNADASALEAFKECKEAYEVLSDGGKRRMYDQHGHAAFEHGMGGGNAGPGHADMGDIFGDIFGNIFGGGGGSRGPRRGADIGYVMELDLEEAVAGIEKRIEIPTMAETLPGYEADAFRGVVAPAGVPKAIIEQLAADIATAIKQPDIRQRLIADGSDPVGSTPQAFAAFLKSEMAKWGKVVKESGARPD